MLSCFFLYDLSDSIFIDYKVRQLIDSLKTNTVEYIRIDSFSRSHSIMHVPIIIITNKDSIETIIGYVKRGEDYSISHLGVMWVQHVVIKSKQNKLILNVYGSSMNGTFIEIVTAEGEVMKTIRTDSLGVYFNGGKEYNIE